MDNEAFRALVNERSRTKTTKEIAREAVEQDFESKKRRKRNRRGAGDSSSDEEGDEDGLSRRWRGEDNNNQEEDENTNEPEWKKLRRLKKRKKDGTDADDANNKYRDRAKERREGKNIDYDNDAELAKMRAAADVLEDEGMSKFLGGDERHTHLVKGLDLALADKVRREEMGMGMKKEKKGSEEKEVGEEGGEIDLDQVRKEAKEIRRGGKDGDILDLDRVPVPTSSLGQGMLGYLQSLQSTTKNKALSSNNSTIGKSIIHPAITTAIHGGKEKFPTAAGVTVQRSTFTFSTIANVGDVLRSWEIPRESTKSQQALPDENIATAINMSFDGNFIERIKSALAIQHELEKREKEAKKKRKKKKKRKDYDHYHDDDDNIEETNDYDFEDAIQIGNGKAKNSVRKGSGDKNGKERDKESNTSKIKKGNFSSSAPQNNGDESDDDIFADAGEYIPPTASSTADKNPKEGTQMKKKGSIFSGLMATAPAAEEIKKEQNDNDTTETIRHHQEGEKRSAKMVHFKESKNNQAKEEDSGKIDRDIFGGRPTPSGKHADTAAGGISIASYEGGYGEEMDVDFGGFAEDEEDGGEGGKRGKGKNSDETTTAAKEYGARGRRPGSNIDEDGGGML